MGQRGMDFLARAAAPCFPASQGYVAPMFESQTYVAVHQDTYWLDCTDMHAYSQFLALHEAIFWAKEILG